jgi:hypothetical protein
MNLMFSDGWTDYWNLIHLMSLGMQIIPAQPRTAVTARHGAVMLNSVTVLSGNERAGSFGMPNWPPRFFADLRLVGLAGC